MNIPFIKMEQVFKIRVVYKSGFTQDFNVTEFSIGNNKAEWTGTKANGVGPILLGLDEIAAVWQLSRRRRITWS